MNRHRGDKCSSCGAEVLFIEQVGYPEKRPHIVEVKRLKIVNDDGQVVSGHESHFAYCPNANQHRRK